MWSKRKCDINIVFWHLICFKSYSKLISWEGVFIKSKVSCWSGFGVYTGVHVTEKVPADYIGHNTEEDLIKTDSVQSSINYLQKLFTKNLLTAR